ALDEVDSVVRCVEMGAEDYLPKPFDPVLLRARIGACLDKKRLRDQEKEHLATIERQADELAGWNRTLEERVAQQVGELERMARLRRFLAPQLAEVIVSSGDESILESHRREVTVVFTDLRGFTAFAGAAEPEEVMAVLREYYAAIGTVTNLASRLCDEAQSGQILLNGRAYLAVEDEVEAEPLDALSLKGFNSAVPAYDVRALKPPAP